MVVSHVPESGHGAPGKFAVDASGDHDATGKASVNYASIMGVGLLLANALAKAGDSGLPNK